MFIFLFLENGINDGYLLPLGIIARPPVESEIQPLAVDK